MVRHTMGDGARVSPMGSVTGEFQLPVYYEKDQCWRYQPLKVMLAACKSEDDARDELGSYGARRAPPARPPAPAHKTVTRYGAGPSGHTPRPVTVSAPLRLRHHTWPEGHFDPQKQEYQPAVFQGTYQAESDANSENTAQESIWLDPVQIAELAQRDGQTVFLVPYRYQRGQVQLMLGKPYEERGKGLHTCELSSKLMHRYASSAAVGQRGEYLPLDGQSAGCSGGLLGTIRQHVAGICTEHERTEQLRAQLAREFMNELTTTAEASAPASPGAPPSPVPSLSGGDSSLCREAGGDGEVSSASRHSHNPAHSGQATPSPPRARTPSSLSAQASSAEHSASTGHNMAHGAGDDETTEGMLRAAIEKSDAIIREHEKAIEELQGRRRPFMGGARMGQYTASNAIHNDRHGARETQMVNEDVAGDTFSGLHSRGVLEVNLAQRSEHRTVINMALPTASEDIHSHDTEVFLSGVQDQEAASHRSPQVRDLTGHRSPWRENVHAAGAPTLPTGRAAQEEVTEP
ncbi:hypothetical protein CYMTET_5230 [Cymbomonas tetramitiformis]|uniref:Uncharacterized protein n=1 Tax=Cymbomonas tetramitiformis TaxID=36881 RepID=A0AAE0LJA3_9CHLO|nr:hypothetical protein CYMTET_5230 [Cymbomonas tetramitiformis]